MSDFPKPISAPALNPTYGANVKDTFENIDSNFNVLANRELYKGDAGTNLVTVNAPWSVVFSNNPTITVGGYTITNFGSDIRAALGAIPGATTTDVNSVVNSLAASNWTIAVSFVETEGTATVISCIPYVFVDPRFRNEGIISSNLQNCTDLSCVITRNGSSTVNGGWVCTQNFPTLYYDYDSETSEGNLYWIINGQKTKILAQGPKGKDGSTGTVYVGLTDDLKLYSSNDSSHSSHNGGVNGGTLDGGVENIDITYLLCTSQLTDDQKSGLSDTSKYPFIPIADWVAIYGSPMTAPIMVLPEDPISSTIDTEVVSPYYISTAYVGTGETTTVSSTVSKYNICYCHMTDVMIKNAIRNNVLRLPNGFPTTSVGDGVIPGYSIKESIGDGGYCIFVPNSGVLTIAYVTDVDEPSESNWDNNNSKLKIVSNIAAGYETGLGHIYSNGLGTLAHGFATDVSTIETNSNGSHAEGYVANEAGANGGSHIKSDAFALGGYARGVAVNGGLIKAGGGGAYAGGYADGEGRGTASDDDNDSLIKSTGQGAHAEGYTVMIGHIKSSASGSFATGYAGADGEIKATAPGAHAEGAVEGMDAVISADGWGAHAEGYVSDGGIIVASQPGAHAEGYAEGYRISADGWGAHAEGAVDGTGGNIIASGVGSHVEGGASEGNSTASGAYSHVEGDTNSASGRCAHAEGMHTSATGSSSHAEGHATTATGVNSHAEGRNTKAYTDYSHAEGCNTIAKSVVGTDMGAFLIFGKNSPSVTSGGYKYYYAYIIVPVGSSYLIQNSNSLLSYFRNNSNIDIKLTSYSDTIRVWGYSFSINNPTLYVGIQRVDSVATWANNVQSNNTFSGGSTAYTALINKYSGPAYIFAADGIDLFNSGYSMQFDGVTNIFVPFPAYPYTYAGNRTTASSIAHAIRVNTNNNSSEPCHAEGKEAYAIGAYSHAEGKNTVAMGMGSYVSGIDSYALGNYSRASGHGVVTTWEGEVAQGKYNASGRIFEATYNSIKFYAIVPPSTGTTSITVTVDGVSLTFTNTSTTTSYSVGSGSDDFSRYNDFFVDNDGSIYTRRIGTKYLTSGMTGTPAIYSKYQPNTAY